MKFFDGDLTILIKLAENSC